MMGEVNTKAIYKVYKVWAGIEELPLDDGVLRDGQ